MKRIHIAALLLVAAGGSLSTLALSKFSNDGAPSLAFTLQVVNTFYEKGEPVAAFADIRAYRENDSSVFVHSYRAKDGTLVELRKISDRAALKQYFVNSFVESVSTTPIAAQSASNPTELRKNCGQPDSAPTKSILGYKAVKAVRGSEVNPPKGFPIVTDVWVAPALRCSVLQSTLIHDGVVKAKIHVASIRLGEPDASLFLIPARYKEMSPKERLDAADLKLGRKAGESFSDVSKITEERYQRARGNLK